MNYTKFGAMLTMLMILAGSAMAEYYYSGVTSTNGVGSTTELFYVGDDVYAKGTGFMPGQECEVYIFWNGNWQAAAGQSIPATGTGSYNVTIGQDIPMDKAVTDGVDVTIAADGTFGNTLVWDGADKTGKFDVIVDCGTDDVWDGVYTNGVPNDGADVTFCIGFTVVPESVIAVGLIALLVPGMIYIARKRKQ